MDPRKKLQGNSKKKKKKKSAAPESIKVLQSERDVADKNNKNYFHAVLSLLEFKKYAEAIALVNQTLQKISLIKDNTEVVGDSYMLRAIATMYLCNFDEKEYKNIYTDLSFAHQKFRERGKVDDYELKLPGFGYLTSLLADIITKDDHLYLLSNKQEKENLLQAPGFIKRLSYLLKVFKDLHSKENNAKNLMTIYAGLLSIQIELNSKRTESTFKDALDFFKKEPQEFINFLYENITKHQTDKQRYDYVYKLTPKLLELFLTQKDIAKDVIAKTYFDLSKAIVMTNKGDNEFTQALIQGAAYSESKENNLFNLVLELIKLKDSDTSFKRSLIEILKTVPGSQKAIEIISKSADTDEDKNISENIEELSIEQQQALKNGMQDLANNHIFDGIEKLEFVITVDQKSIAMAALIEKELWIKAENNLIEHLKNLMALAKPESISVTEDEYKKLIKYCNILNKVASPIQRIYADLQAGLINFKVENYKKTLEFTTKGIKSYNHLTELEKDKEYRLVISLLSLHSNCHSKLNQIDKATKDDTIIKKIKETYENHLTFIFKLIQIIAEGNIDKGIEDARVINFIDMKEIVTDPRYNPSSHQLIEQILKIKLKEATELIDKKDFTQIKSALNLCHFVTLFSSPKDRADAFCFQAKVYLHKSRYLDAIRELDQALIEDPNNLTAIKLRANTEVNIANKIPDNTIQKRYYNRALLNVENALLLKSDDKESIQLKEMLLNKLKMIDQAELKEPITKESATKQDLKATTTTQIKKVLLSEIPEGKEIKPEEIRPELTKIEQNLQSAIDSITKNDFDQLIASMQSLNQILDQENKLQNLNTREQTYAKENIKLAAKSGIDRANQFLTLIIQEQDLEPEFKIRYCQQLIKSPHIISQAALGEAYYQYAQTLSPTDIQESLIICGKALESPISPKSKSKILKLKEGLEQTLNQQEKEKAIREQLTILQRDMTAINDLKHQLTVQNDQFKQEFNVLKQNRSITQGELKSDYEKYRIKINEITARVTTLKKTISEYKISDIQSSQINDKVITRDKHLAKLSKQIDSQSLYFQKTLDSIKNGIIHNTRDLIKRSEADSKTVYHLFETANEAFNTLSQMEQKKSALPDVINHQKSILTIQFIKIESTLKDQKINLESLRIHDPAKYEEAQKDIANNQVALQKLTNNYQGLKAKLRQIEKETLSENIIHLNNIELNMTELTTIINNLHQPNYTKYTKDITSQKISETKNPKYESYIDTRTTSLEIELKNLQFELDKAHGALKQIDHVIQNLKMHLLDPNQKDRYSTLLKERNRLSQELDIFISEKNEETTAFHEIRNEIEAKISKRDNIVKLAIQNINTTTFNLTKNTLLALNLAYKLSNMTEMGELKNLLGEIERQTTSLSQDRVAIKSYGTTETIMLDESTHAVILKAKNTIKQCETRIKKAEQVLIHQALLKEAKLEENIDILIDLVMKYPGFVFKGSFAAYAGLLANLPLIAKDLTINDFDTLLTHADPFPIAKALEEKEGFSSTPSLNRDGSLKFITLRKQTPDNKWIDITLGPLNYRGDQFISGFSSLKLFLLPEEKVDHNKFAVIDIGKKLCLCIDKTHPHYPDFLHAIGYENQNASYMVAPHDPDSHERYFALAVKNLKKLKKLFPKLRIDEKSKYGNDGKPKLISYQDLLNSLGDIFYKAFTSGIFKYEVNCFIEISVLIKRFGITDPDIQPFLQALIRAMIFKANPALNSTQAESLVASVTHSIHQYYQDNPYLHDQEIEDPTKRNPLKNIDSHSMRLRFDSIIAQQIGPTPTFEFKHEPSTMPSTQYMQIQFMGKIDPTGAMYPLSLTDIVHYPGQLYFYDNQSNMIEMTKQKVMNMAATNPNALYQLYALTQPNVPVIMTEAKISGLRTSPASSHQQSSARTSQQGLLRRQTQPTPRIESEVANTTTLAVQKKKGKDS